MAAAAGNGDEQVRIEGSTAHDPADGIDSFSLRVTNFSSQSSAHAVGYRTSKLRRGQQWMASKAHCHDQPQGLLLGATVIRTSGSEGAILWKCEHVRMDFCRCFLHRAHYQRRSESGVSPPGATCAEGGVVVPHRARCLRRRGSGRTPRRRQVELPRLARPKGCFDTSAEWS